MFESSEYPKALNEDVFNEWLQRGRDHKLPYHYLLIAWDSYDSCYKPIYVEDRISFEAYEKYGEAIGREALVAVYDLYSETRIL